MPDEVSASAIAPEQTRPLRHDGRLTWTVAEAARLLGISRASAYGPRRTPRARPARATPGTSPGAATST